MSDIVNEYFKKFYPEDWQTHDYEGPYSHEYSRRYRGHKGYECFPRIVCADGFSLSVQARHVCYCEPRGDFEPQYYSVEVGYPSSKDDLLMPYAEGGPDCDGTDTVYGYVPVDVVAAVIEKHGGIAK
jgi:hypothetical protein